MCLCACIFKSITRVSITNRMAHYVPSVRAARTIRRSFWGLGPRPFPVFTPVTHSYLKHVFVPASSSNATSSLLGLRIQPTNRSEPHTLCSLFQLCSFICGDNTACAAPCVQGKSARSTTDNSFAGESREQRASLRQISWRHMHTTVEET